MTMRYRDKLAAMSDEEFAAEKARADREAARNWGLAALMMSLSALLMAASIVLRLMGH